MPAPIESQKNSSKQPEKHSPQPSRLDAALAPDPAIAILECRPSRILAKCFRSDGTRIDFQAGREFKIHDVDVAGRDDLFELLTLLVECPRLCLVRGACPRADATAWVYRRLRDKPGEPANFRSVARRWVVYDFDDTALPFKVTAPEASIRAWHATLPAELRAAGGAFFPSASAHASATVRGKLVVWYDRPISERLARQFAVHYRADPCVAGAVQPNYFAAPIFEGCRDPLARHRTILFDGGDAKPPPRVALRATRMRPAPVRVGELPPGDRGIVAALGPHENLIGARFHVCGALGGLMRKLGYPPEACEAVLRAWLPRDSSCDVQKGVDWALGAWARWDGDKGGSVWRAAEYERATVSGTGRLSEILGIPHATLIFHACMAARPWGVIR